MSKPTKHDLATASGLIFDMGDVPFSDDKQSLIAQALAKAREEGYRRGYDQGILNEAMLASRKRSKK